MNALVAAAAVPCRRAVERLVGVPRRQIDPCLQHVVDTLLVASMILAATLPASLRAGGLTPGTVVAFHQPPTDEAGDSTLRSWSDRTGSYQIRASLLKLVEGVVHLKTEDGRTIEVPVERLSESDQEFLKRHRGQSTPRTGSPSTTPEPKPGGNAPPRDDQPRFILPGLISIGIPDEGYTWSVAKEGESNGVQFRVLVCRKEGSDSAITLTIEQRPAKDDARRVATIKGHLVGLMQTFEQAGFTDMKVQQPSLRAPISTVVPYAVKCIKPDGSPVFVRAATIFRENTFAFQAIAPTDAETIKLVRVLPTLKELNADTN